MTFYNKCSVYNLYAATPQLQRTLTKDAWQTAGSSREAAVCPASTALPLVFPDLWCGQESGLLSHF